MANQQKIKITVGNLPSGTGPDCIDVNLIKEFVDAKLEISLPQKSTEPTSDSGSDSSFTKLDTESDQPITSTAPANSDSVTAVQAVKNAGQRRRRADLGELQGLYTIPENSEGEKLPMKIINPAKIQTRMRDVGGYDEAKLEVIEFVNFIKKPDQYLKLGAHLPKGAILHGAPGTGKTLLARATAGEANVPFIACNAAQFLVNDGVEKLEQVFDEARKHTPCILFFDEIDCIGRRRPNRGQAPSVLHQSLLEELLCQLDGFISHTDSMLIVLGATNEMHNMDPALLRPGRFDRTIPVDLPNLTARWCIYMVHMRPLVTSLDKKEIARKLALMSQNLTGAKISTVCNEAAMIAARDLNSEISYDHFEQALDRVKTGIRKKVGDLSVEEKRCAAYHNAGHGVYGWFTADVDPISKLSVVPKTNGRNTCCQYNVQLHDQTCFEENIISLIMMHLAGRAAEQLFIGKTSAINAVDLDYTMQMAMSLICKLGMNEVMGPMCVAKIMPWECNVQSLCPLPEGEKEVIYQEVKKLIFECYDKTKDFVKDHAEQIEKVAEALIARNELSRDDCKEVLGERPFPDTPIYMREPNEEEFLPVGMLNWRE